MQKLLRIQTNKAQLTVRQARKTALEKERYLIEQHRKRQSAQGKDLSRRIKAERKTRREDWLAGPLAADRNSGLGRGTLGAMSDQVAAFVAGKPTIKHRRKGREEEGKGLGLEDNIIVGDRVVIVEKGHPLQGQIGEVENLDKQQRTVRLQNLNTVDMIPPVHAPPQMRNRPFIATSFPLPFESIRLVTKIAVTNDDPNPDSEELNNYNTPPPSGNVVYKDVIVRAMYKGPPYTNREAASNFPEHTRYIVGTDIAIDWPGEEEVEVQEFHDGADTARKWVEEQSYVPSVLEATQDVHDASIGCPVPADCIREIYKKRTEGRKGMMEHKWVANKIIEDVRSAWYQDRKLITPAEMLALQPGRVSVWKAQRLAAEERHKEEMSRSLENPVDSNQQIEPVEVAASIPADPIPEPQASR